MALVALHRSALLLSVLLLMAAGCSLRPTVEVGPSAFAVPLLATEPDFAADADLRVLADWLEGATVVGLGERDHGTHELHRLAHRLFAYLVEHEGFSVFALEVDQAHAALLDEYVRGSRDDLEALLADRWWASSQFYDEALVALLRWMRKHNETAARPVRFAGYDLKQPDLAMQSLLAELQQLDPKAASEAGQQFQEISRLGGFGGVPSFIGYSARLPLPIPRGDGSVRRLTVALQARSSGWSRGSAGFAISTGGASLQTATLPMEDLAAGAPAWRALEVSIDVPVDAAQAVLTIFHRGNGTVWFDGLRAHLNETPVPLAADLADAVPLPLQMPHLQVMDYTAAADGRSLRVECDPRLDEALSAARRIVAITSDQVTRHQELAPERAAWLRQLARLVLQATEWRTRAQLNRDVFLAENLTWLSREASLGGRILALAHTSHTERLPARMGAYLAEGFGGAYRAVSMLPLEGEYLGFGDVATLTPDAPLRVFPLAASEAAPLVQYAASRGPGDLMLALRDAAAAEGGYPRGVDGQTAPDVAILVRRVSASRLITP